MNQVWLSGNLGADPDFKVTTSGTPVMNLRMATREWSKADGERSEWHNVVIWGNQAEGLSKILRKGSFLIVVGRLQTRKWQDRDGQDRYTTEVVAINTELGPKQQQQGAPAQQQQRPQPRPQQQRPPVPQQGNDWTSGDGFEPPPEDDPFAKYGDNR
jgi:single-strand DNA-binding protein